MNPELCSIPIDIECRAKENKQDWLRTGQVFSGPCRLGMEGGLVCHNADQPGNQTCHDYEVRYKCTEGWFRIVGGVKPASHCPIIT